MVHIKWLTKLNGSQIGLPTIEWLTFKMDGSLPNIGWLTIKWLTKLNGSQIGLPTIEWLTFKMDGSLPNIGWLTTKYWMAHY